MITTLAAIMPSPVMSRLRLRRCVTVNLLIGLPLGCVPGRPRLGRRVNGAQVWDQSSTVFAILAQALIFLIAVMYLRRFLASFGFQ